MTQDDIDVGLLEVINDIIMDENDDEFETGEETLANFVDTIPKLVYYFVVMKCEYFCQLCVHVTHELSSNNYIPPHGRLI